MWPTGGRGHPKNRRRPHEPGLSISAKPSMLRDFKADQKAVHGTSGEGLDRLPVSRGAWRRTQRQSQRYVSSWAFHERRRGGTANAAGLSAPMCSRQGIMSKHEETFKDFAAVARKRGHTAESLAERFRGKIENPSEFFERVMTCRYKGEDRSWVVIPYRSVLEFYNQELHYFRDSNPKQRTCACGCGLPVFEKRKWASAACRKRVQRQCVTDMPKGVRQVSEIIDAKVGQKWVPSLEARVAPKVGH
jgi:hypothetical protein